MDGLPSPHPSRPEGSPARTTFWEPGHQTDDPSEIGSPTADSHDGHDDNESRTEQNDDASSHHIMVQEPRARPSMPGKRNTFKGSHRQIQEALRLQRAREEQEMLLSEHEEADDDGCYPPRKNDEPRTPNPHAHLPVYTTIHKIRKLIVACIGAACSHTSV